MMGCNFFAMSFNPEDSVGNMYNGQLDSLKNNFKLQSSSPLMQVFDLFQTAADLGLGNKACGLFNQLHPKIKQLSDLQQQEPAHTASLQKWNFSCLS